MKSIFLLVLTIMVVAWPVSSDTQPDCCKFMMFAADFSCPATQLADGQVRFVQHGFNHTCKPSQFCIDKQGAITDSRGFGCIVTRMLHPLLFTVLFTNHRQAEPETQIQCDEGKKPHPVFSIGPNRDLLVNGSDTFFVCPASETQWNIYQWPTFGQKKCYGLRLWATGCAPPPVSSPPPSTSPSASCADVTTTVWMTQSVTQLINHTVTAGCASSSSSMGWNSSMSSWRRERR